MGFVILACMIILAIYQKEVRKEEQRIMRDSLNLKRWSELKRKGMFWFLDMCYLRIYEDLKQWEYNELVIAKALCRKKICDKSIWLDAIPIMALILSCGSIFFSVIGIVFTKIPDDIFLQELDNTSKSLEEYLMIFFIVVIGSIVFWILSGVKKVVTHKYKALLYMCESILEMRNLDIKKSE